MKLNRYKWKLVSVSEDHNHANFAKLDGEVGDSPEVLVETMHRFGKAYQRKMSLENFNKLLKLDQI